MPYEYDYPRPALTVDCAVFAPVDGRLEVLLIQRDESPFEGRWATPGGFVEIDEPVAEAAPRELAEETGMRDGELVQFGLFDEPGRDPRGRIVAAADWGLTRRDHHDLEAATDAREFGWFDVDDLPDLAFDHDELVPAALGALRARVRTGPIGRGVIEAPFELDELQSLYETILDRDLEDDVFRRAIRRSGFLDAAGGSRGEVAAVGASNSTGSATSASSANR
ncbi:MAG: NUDIX domain-containing protein [Bradymonadaceae bacterium]